MRLEVCCGSYEDALVAIQNGAHRIELNSALYLGGLTPSYATLLKVMQVAKQNHVSVIAMIRPRGAGFCYSKHEIEVMFEDAKWFLEAGVDGLAFGFLTSERLIDFSLTQKMCGLIHAYQKEAVFHRAFDCVDNLTLATKQLINCGVDRILTSGGQPTAPQGVEVLAILQEQFGSQIEILPGCGINASNVQVLIQQTKVHQVHSSCKDYACDETTSGTNVTYAYYSGTHQNDYECVSAKNVIDMIQALSK